MKMQNKVKKPCGTKSGKVQKPCGTKSGKVQKPCGTKSGKVQKPCDTKSKGKVRFCRYRKVRGKSNKILDAHDYGYEAWCFPIK